jgi:hypothetical protein
MPLDDQFTDIALFPPESYVALAEAGTAKKSGVAIKMINHAAEKSGSAMINMLASAILPRAAKRRT